MMKQTIVWSVLPDPAKRLTSDRVAHLALVVSPRLSVDEDPMGLTLATLGDFPDMADWPSTRLDLRVEVVGPSRTALLPATFLDEPPALELWGAVFPPSLSVAPFSSETATENRRILSYPAAQFHAAVKEEYGVSVESIDNVVAELQPGGLSGSWGRVDRLIRNFAASRPNRAGSERASINSMHDPLDTDLTGSIRLSEFHRTTGEDRRLDRSRAERVRRGVSTEREFHRVVAALADHPEMLKRLGLVRRAGVVLPDGLTGSFTIRAIPSHGRSFSDYCPGIRCLVQDGRFTLQDADGNPALFLKLNDGGRFNVIDVDLDAAGLALKAYVSTLERSARDRPPPPVHLPALSSDGIFVAEADREVTFQAALEAAQHLNGDLSAGGKGDQTILDAASVLQGYRIDVFDEGSGRWYSLCRRVATYKVKGMADPIVIEDEGSVSEALAESVQDAETVNKLHQAVFRWSGWSLVAPPPGKMVGLDGEVADPVPAPDPTLPFSSTVSVAKGTLPSLRFGRTYRFRARLVDIGGQSALFEARHEEGATATAPLRYRRYEPVPSPVLVPRRAMTGSESVDVMVVRTDNRSATPVSGPPSERHLLAPKAPVLLLERHGVLDVPGEHRLTPDAYQLLFDRDKRVVAGTTDPSSEDVQFVETDAMELPWLPDPLARGVTFSGLPGIQELTFAWPQGPQWHERTPLRLVLEPGSLDSAAPVRVEGQDRVVRMRIQPGLDLEIQLSSQLHPGDEEVIGTWNLLAGAEPRSSALIETRRRDMISGKVRQITPSCSLRLVHAVRCPLEPPALGDPTVAREQGATSYEITDDSLLVHRPTTVSVEVEAKWTEIIDDPQKPRPERFEARAVIGQSGDDLVAAWDSAAGGEPLPFRAVHELGDTRHREIEYRPIATSRFASYFSERRSVNLSGTAAVGIADSFVRGTVTVRERFGSVEEDSFATPPRTYSNENDVEIGYESGTIARRANGAVPDGAEVEVSFVVPPVTREGFGAFLSVPSSARPAPPAVHSILPAYQWREHSQGGGIVSTRTGGLLRIFLERPWFVSGEGEVLAVLIADEDLIEPQPGTGLSHPTTFTRTLDFVSRVGGDPTPLGGSAPAALEFNRSIPRSAFPRAVTDQVIRVPDLHRTNPAFVADEFFRIRAMGHTVAFDERRGLWFADVEIDLPDSYQPFVLLKLARLQPAAVKPSTPGVHEDLHLSPIVDASFHQLPAHRKAEVIMEGDSVSISVTGACPGPQLPEMTATLEIADTVGDLVVWEDLDRFPQTPLAGTTISPDGRFARWSGIVALPPPAGTQRRLLIREYEVLPGDPRSDAPVRRLTYLDTLRL